MALRIETTLIQATSSKLWDAGDLVQLESAADLAAIAVLRDGAGRTLLHEAANSGAMAATQTLLGAGADVNAADLVGETPLIQAARSGHAAVVDTLLAAGADVNAHHLEGWTALATAVIRGHQEIVVQILRCGPRLDTEVLSPGMGLVRMAVQIGDATILRELVRAGAPHALRGFDTRTPIELARYLNHTDCERVLLELT